MPHKQKGRLQARPFLQAIVVATGPINRRLPAFSERVQLIQPLPFLVLARRLIVLVCRAPSLSSCSACPPSPPSSPARSAGPPGTSFICCGVSAGLSTAGSGFWSVGPPPTGATSGLRVGSARSGIGRARPPPAPQIHHLSHRQQARHCPGQFRSRPWRRRSVPAPSPYCPAILTHPAPLQTSACAWPLLRPRLRLLHRSCPPPPLTACFSVTARLRTSASRPQLRGTLPNSA